MPNATTDAAAARSLNTDTEEARLLGCSVSHLRKDRRTHKRIPFIRLSAGIIRYDHQRVLEALLTYEEGGECVQDRRKRAKRPHETTARIATQEVA